MLYGIRTFQFFVKVNKIVIEYEFYFCFVRQIKVLEFFFSFNLVIGGEVQKYVIFFVLFCGNYRF